MAMQPAGRDLFLTNAVRVTLGPKKADIEARISEIKVQIEETTSTTTRRSRKGQIGSGEVDPRLMTILFRSQETSMGKLTPEETAREHNRGQKAASEGRSRNWSESWAYPFESDEHFEGRREAFEQGFDPSFMNTAKTGG